MKKILIVFLCLLTGGLVYWAWPEYGSGYSEQQRRLWNERRSIYPVTWILEGSGPMEGMCITIGSSYSDIASITRKTSTEVEVLIKRKKGLEKDLVAELEANRDRLGPDYRVKMPLSVDTGRLPLNGLTEKKIAARALAGEGDACLKMAQYLCWSAHGGDIIQLSWRERHEVEKWLDLAIAAKRPGAEFLKTLFNQILNFQKSQTKYGGHMGTGGKFKIEDTPGYGDFVECLKAGDYLAYAPASWMLSQPELSREREMICSVLRKGARQGKVENQRDFALMTFEEGLLREGVSFPYSRINGEMDEKERNWVKLFEWLPASWSESVVAGLFFCKVIDAEKTSAMKSYREASEYARMAALQGDLTGMHLWMWHGTTAMDRFSAKEWADIFEYDRILSEAGHAHYTMGKYLGWRGGTLYDTILRSYYSKKSYGESLKSDNPFSRDIAFKFSPEESLESVRKKIQDYCLTGHTDLFLNDSKSGWDMMMSGASKEVREYLLEQAEQWAEQGDIHAMYRLAGVYGKGTGVPADPGRAYAWYGKALHEADKYPLFVLCIPDEDGISGYSNEMQLKHAVRLRMAELVLRYSDFPGRDEKEPYELLLDSVHNSGDRRMPDYCYAVLGLFHERGIGRPVDRLRATELYKKGKQESKTCREGEARLTAFEKKE